MQHVVTETASRGHGVVNWLSGKNSNLPKGLVNAPKLPDEVQATLAVPQRGVKMVLDDVHTIEGGSFEIQRPFPTRQLRNFDPFLLFDEFGPTYKAPGESQRESHLGQHPHRGFEAITVLIEGEFYQADTTGKYGKLSAGGVQVMTAGGGIVHGGHPTPEVVKNGGRLHGLQIWLNLKAVDRMVPARTRDYEASQMPTAISPDGLTSVHIFSGTAMGVTSSVVETHVPITMLHFKLQPGGSVVQEIPEGYNVMVHVSTGRGLFGPDQLPASQSQAVIYENDGSNIITFSNPVYQPSSASSKPSMASGKQLIPAGAPGVLDVLLLAGLPTNEPVIQHGPFVGSNQQEIAQAMTDYRAGRMGSLNPDGSANLTYYREQ